MIYDNLNSDLESRTNFVVAPPCVCA